MRKHKKRALLFLSYSFLAARIYVSNMFKCNDYFPLIVLPGQFNVSQVHNEDYIVYRKLPAAMKS